MKKKPKSRSGKIDFISNKLNKYSIRKFTVGTASILVGATLLFGLGDEAKADEVSNEDLVKAQSKSSQNDEKSNDINGDNSSTLTEELSTEEKVTEKASLEKESTEENTLEDNVTDEVSSEEPVIEEKSPEENREVILPTEKTNQEDKASEKFTSEESSTEKKASEPVSIEENITSVNQTKEQPITEEKTTPELEIENSRNEEVSIDGTSSTQAKVIDQPTNFSEEDLVNEVDDKIKNLSDDDRKLIIDNAKINFKEDSLEDVKKKISLEAIRYQSKKIDKNKVPATTSRNYTGFRAVPMVDTNTEASGQNVNDKVVINNFNLDKRKFDPNQSGFTNMNVSFRITNSIKEGDYFTFDVPNNLSLDGDIDYSKVGYQMNLAKLKNENGDIIATGTYNTKTKQGKYIFTNFVNEKEKVKGSFEIPIFTDRKESPRSGNYPVSFNIAGKRFNSTINLDYSSPFAGVPGANGANISSNINKIDNKSGERTYKQVIYVNPLAKQLYGSNVNVKGYYDDPTVSSTLVNSDNTRYKIYEVINPNLLNESYFVDPNDGNFKDVTANFNGYITDNNDNSTDIKFGDINKAYVILVDGHYDESENDVLTRVTETNRDYYGNPSSFYWDNRNILRFGSGNGDGENIPKYNLGDYVWEDTNKDGVQDEGEKGIGNVTVILKDKDGQEIGRAITDESGKYIFRGLKNGDYKVEFETPAGYKPTIENNGDDAKDSDGLNVNVRIQDADNMTIDSGFYKEKPKYNLGDYVWEDTNKDGVQDEGEKGIGNVTVILKDKDGQEIARTTTDETGKYIFRELENGKYTVEFETPQGYTPTVKDQGGNDEKDSDGLKVEVTINDEDDMSIDSGFYKEDTDADA
ncbi:fibrinogen-binding adhesin SdrG C-terminal domain-containing protein, partial [Staphylococcus schleiferi]|nr:fibrinogen-binding adhesin SdrG C-terminal domain-containing protein [Staphylococcus schleiferi]